MNDQVCRPSREDVEALVERAFEIGFAWRADLVGQTLEDSRAVGRTLLSDLFEGVPIKLDGWDSFQSADLGIYEGKRRIKVALSALVLALPPEGWVLVPMEPTEAMLDAFHDGLHSCQDDRFSECATAGLRAAILSLAPPVVEHQEGEG